jgi:type I restriction enzyme, S subunit
MNNIPLGWSCLQFKYAFKAVPFTTKIKQKEYALTGQYPIIDQGEYFIGGYSDNNYGLITDIPVIAFGDHTRRFKYIDFPFIPGADGLKIYKPIYSETKFSFYQCLTLEFPNRGYARHNALLQKCHFYLPPLDEQGRIVEKIEELFSDIDNGIKDLKTAQAQIKQYRQSVLKSAFEGKLYKTSEWKEAILEQHIEEINYGTSEKTKDFGKIPVLRMGDIQEGKLVFNNLKYLDAVNDSKLLLKKGDLLFNRTNSAELVGKSAVFNNEGTYSFASYIIKVRCKNTLNSNFICYYINSTAGRAWAKTQISQQVGQANINGTKLKNLSFLYPTIPEQQQIVAEIEKRFAVADEMEKAVNDNLLQAEKLKQSILKQAFAGKLVPQNPNDEPAAVLLERIKAAKENSTKGKK